MEHWTRHEKSLLPMTSAPPLAVDDLTCRYGELVALDRLSMILEDGEILGVTGTPGAGMSTLIKAIMMLVAPQAGRVLINGNPHDLASSRAHIAYLPETIRPPGHLAGHDFLAMAHTVRPGMSQDIDMAGLASDLTFDHNLLDHPIRRYAKDDVQKLGLMTMFSAGRPILLLDRPMLDLDPTARAGLRHRLKTHAANGGAVLIGSHAIEDHQGVVDRLFMLKDGRLHEADTIEIFNPSDAAA